jgi:uncharacterized membrane protein
MPLGQPAAGAPALLALLVTGGVNIVVCYFVARPVQGVGILPPGVVPAIVAALLALTITPGDAAPVAFIAAVAGPLIGADRLHPGRSKRAQSERRALAGPERSTVPSFRGLLRRI